MASETIKLSERASGQVRSMLDAIKKLDEQLQVYVTAAQAALDVPEGWQFNVNEMAFVPPAPAPEGETVAPSGDHDDDA